MVVRMRHTKGHTANRRSHHALEAARISTCPSCGAAMVRHRMCEKCGTYRGRTVIDIKVRNDRSQARKQAKLKARGEAAEKVTKEDKKEE